MFLSPIEQIEENCQMKLQQACSMAEAMSGTGGEHLKGFFADVASRFPKDAGGFHKAGFLHSIRWRG